MWVKFKDYHNKFSIKNIVTALFLNKLINLINIKVILLKKLIVLQYLITKYNITQLMIRFY